MLYACCGWLACVFFLYSLGFFVFFFYSSFSRCFFCFLFVQPSNNRLRSNISIWLTSHIPLWWIVIALFWELKKVLIWCAHFYSPPKPSHFFTSHLPRILLPPASNTFQYIIIISSLVRDRPTKRPRRKWEWPQISLSLTSFAIV